ncbi:MAG TPA: hypothetical protein DEA08_28985 [Planctomycetes bacterium]|nr:hypothetical protein [Planctomycetota bacterium]
MTVPQGLPLEQIVATSPVATLVTDLTGSIVYVNDRFCALSGYSAEELVGQSTRLLKSGCQPPAYYAELWATLSRGETWQGFFQNRAKDGSLFAVRATIAPLRDTESGEVSHYVGLEEDLSEERSLAAQLRRSQRLESLGVMAGGIAHEFNNLLTPIFGYLDLIRASEPSSQSQRYIDHVERAAERARALVAQILAFSREVAQGSEQVDLLLLVKESLKLARASFSTQVEIGSTIEPGAHFVQADPALLHQVLMNFIANAYYAMRAKGGQLQVSLQRVELSVAEAAAIEPSMAPGVYEVVAVKDEGEGIAPEVISKVFDPFFTTKPSGTGTGLGLSEARGIALESGGGIGVESEVGVGSTFSLYVPAVPKAEPDVPPTSTKGGGSERILFVDDEPEIAALGKELLSQYGYEVISKSSSVEALVAIHEGLEVDLLVTDQVMPHLTGVQLAREIHAKQPDLPVLLVTGFSDEVDAGNFAQLGLAGFMRKPLRPGELAATIRGILDRQPLKVGPQAR